MFNIGDLFNKKDLDKATMTKEDVAAMLKIDKNALEKFENSYALNVLSKEDSDNFFDLNSRIVAKQNEGVLTTSDFVLSDIINRIVKELLCETIVWTFDGKNVVEEKMLCDNDVVPVTNEELSKLPIELRPQLTGSLMKRDINEPSYISLLFNYKMFLEEKDERKKAHFYHLFRQGLDILDLDPITYKIIETNPNSMSHWLPQIVSASKDQNFFKIPKTTIVKIPITLLQLTRIEYSSLTKTTLEIVDLYCKEIFKLNENEDYFIKTGTYSSKFDFRNALVTGAKEVNELGEYLLFIHHQACQMAAPLNNKSIYGVSTTTEWVVREFIHDKENNPCIYKGLPLHTEYRAFVDFDTKQILGIAPYWDSKLMKQRFGHSNDSDSPHMVHDYIIYTSHEELLMKRYNDNIEKVQSELASLVNDTIGLSGQWSIDIMQNEEDFWIIDMALAVNSALNECVPKGLLNKVEENWLPQLD